MDTIAKSKYSALSDTALREALAPYGVALDPSQVGLVQLYLTILLRWNERINLTSVNDPRTIIERHFGESMFSARLAPINEGRLADVGSGAGFPGLALKIAVPKLQVVLIEANKKKNAFLGEVRRRLELENVQILGSRLEDLPARPASFDFVTARAVGGFDRLLEWSRTVLGNDGQLVLWLGAKDAEEIARRPNWNWRASLPIPQSLGRVLLIGRPA